MYDLSHRIAPSRLVVIAALIWAMAGCGEDTTGPTDDPGPTGDYAKIETWAGSGINGSTPDGTALANAEFSTPQDLAFGPNGRPYIVDWNNHRILEVRNGRHYAIIGNGTLGAAEDGPLLDDPLTPQAEAGLNHPTHLAWDPQGRIIMSAWHNSKIMRCDVGTNQMLRIAGKESADSGGNRCYEGDGGPVEDSCLDLPVCTGFDAEGNMYIADQKNIRIRKVTAIGGEITPESIIDTIVGTGNTHGEGGQGGFNGHDLPGLETDLSAPGSQAAPPSSRMIVFPNGEIIFCDSSNNLVRKLDSSGIVRNVAGGGLGVDENGVPRSGYAGDGGLATEASLYFPTDVDIDSAGNLYIADCFNSSIRKIDTNGIITTFAGRGQRNPDPFGDNGDGGAPDQAWLDRPYGIAINADDDIYIVNTHAHNIRVIRK